MPWPGAPWHRGGGRRKTDTMRIRTSIALGVLGAWVCAAPGVAQESASPGRESAVMKALRAPASAASGGLLAQAAPATVAQQPAPILPPAGSPPLLRYDSGRVPDPGQRLGHRSADLPVLHPDAAEPAERRRLGALRRRGREIDPRGLQAAVGHQLPRQPLDRGERRPVRQRRHRQGSRLQHGGAPARQDRRLRRHPRRSSSRRSKRSSGRRTSRSGSTRSSIRRWSAGSRASFAACSRRRATSSPR